MTNTCAVPAEHGFSLGDIHVTASAKRELSPNDIANALTRHLWGDSTELPEDDREEGFRHFSIHHTKAGRRFWIITEADESATTVLMPEDY